MTHQTKNPNIWKILTTFIRITAISLTFITIYPSCKNFDPKKNLNNKLTEKQKTSAEDTVKALRKMQAASKGNINYLNYSQLEIDMISKNLETQNLLPDGELKTEIMLASSAYSDVADIWKQSFVKVNGLMSSEILEVTKLRDGKEAKSKYKDVVTSWSELSYIFPPIWQEAEKHVNKASNLLR